MTKSVEIRDRLVRTLRRDLIGPGEEDADLAAEVLTEAPSRWYLTGYLAPVEGDAADVEDDPSQQEELENLAGDGSIDAETPAPDDEPPEAPVARRRVRPTSIGITALLPANVEAIDVVVTWGEYRTEPPLPASVLSPEPATPPTPKDIPSKLLWVRSARRETVRLAVPKNGRAPPALVPNSTTPMKGGGALVLEAHARPYQLSHPDGSVEDVRALSVFLVNHRHPVLRRVEDVAFVFQARIELQCEAGFAARRDLSGWKSSDEDVRIADLHYRDVCDYAIGRSASAGWAIGADSRVTRVWTETMPTAEVERVAPNESMPKSIEFGMEALAEAATTGAQELGRVLADLPKAYATWIGEERTKREALDAECHRDIADDLLDRMDRARGRIEAGIAVLKSNDRARLAFRFMNEALARASRQRDPKRYESSSPTWRPFQLAFILLTLAGIVDKKNDDRETVDLLFFPTGGGKTEAYLGLAAFTIALRRLGASGELGAGVAVVMRYTLRLLTLDQLARAAGVICALELARTDPKHAEKGQPLLGTWPIEIGLWVGSDASPNRMGGVNDTGDATAVTRVRKYRKGDTDRAPAPIKACPWCQTPLGKDSFRCVPNDKTPINLEIRCANPDCVFIGDRPLPILVVDGPIYRRLPAFLIATLDKFAGLPWLGEAGAFFNHVDRFDPAIGFYGAAEPLGGRPLDNGWMLDPPDLIIQDELHLISGPLGTVAGLYETAIDRLCWRERDGKRIRPKIIASTATVRRAQTQIAQLFDRSDTQIFPPPGLDRTDSFFALTRPASEDPARLYVGLAAQGKGPKLVFLRGLTTLLAASQAAFDTDGAAADPYMTAACYFNALRELGGARRIVEDEVRARLETYGAKRRRSDPEDQPFADRRMRDPLELTSRVSTDDVAKAKQDLEREFGAKGGVDVALATNMISVGLDITRLGLMLVQGQPKAAAEYIQATSRVGRDHNRPGLVVAVLNLHKPRDRMHFEQFGHFHRTFYRSVEATSVTPWAARALDRALAAVVVTLARHLDPSLTPESAAAALESRPDLRTRVRDTILERAPPGAIAGGLQSLVDAIDRLFAEWSAVAQTQRANGVPFKYGAGRLPGRLLHVPLDPAARDLDPGHRLFTANRSMRDVEMNVRIDVRDPFGGPINNARDLA